MKNIKIKRICTILSFLIVCISMMTHVLAANVTLYFYCKDTSNNAISNSTLEVAKNTATSRQSYSMPSGNTSLVMSTGTSFGYNMLANNYAKRYSGASMTAVPSSSTSYTLKLTSKSVYQNLGYGTPLDSLSLTSGFGWRIYWNGTSYVRDCHFGMDYSGTDGVTNIYSISDASSYTTGWDSSSGNYVQITTSNGYTITYRHMHSYSNAVNNGYSISKGDALGKVGSTGNVTGPHLHIDIYGSGTYRDPSAFFN